MVLVPFRRALTVSFRYIFLIFTCDIFITRVSLHPSSLVKTGKTALKGVKEVIYGDSLFFGSPPPNLSELLDTIHYPGWRGHPYSSVCPDHPHSRFIDGGTARVRQGSYNLKQLNGRLAKWVIIFQIFVSRSFAQQQPWKCRVGPPSRCDRFRIGWGSDSWPDTSCTLRHTTCALQGSTLHGKWWCCIAHIKMFYFPLGWLLAAESFVSFRRTPVSVKYSDADKKNSISWRGAICPAVTMWSYLERIRLDHWKRITIKLLMKKNHQSRPSFCSAPLQSINSKGW